MDKSIRELIDQMTLDQKVGATLTLGFAGTLPRRHIYDYITKYHCGGLRLSPIFRKFGNYIDPISGEVIVNVTCKDHLKEGAPAYLTADEYREILKSLQEMAQKRPLGLPLHFSYDQEGGTSADFNFGGVEVFPKPMGLRATNDAKYAYETAIAIGKQSRAVGFNFVHSPVLDVNVEPKNPEIYTRAYSDDAKVVTAYARETCRGFKEVGVVATGKHFPGRGASAVDAHYNLPIIEADYKTLVERDLYPYKVLIEEDLLPSIMIAHSIYPAIDPDHVATVSKKVVTGLLRETLGFKGVITTDSMTMGALATRYGVANACAMALEAGCDLVLMKAENELVEDTFMTIKDFVLSGRIPEEDLDEKVGRILSMKKAYGMFDQDLEAQALPVIEAVKAKGLAEEIAQKSILPFKGKVVLPLSKKERILVVEQRNKNVPNDRHWYYGQLYYSCLALSANVDYFEIDYTISKEDETLLLKTLASYDTVIMTNFYVRSKQANNGLVEKIEATYKGKYIVVDNTPYGLSAPICVTNRLTTLATTPKNLEAVAKVLFEGLVPLGVYPLENPVDFCDQAVPSNTSQA